MLEHDVGGQAVFASHPLAELLAQTRRTPLTPDERFMHKVHRRGRANMLHLSSLKPTASRRRGYVDKV